MIALLLALLGAMDVFQQFALTPNPSPRGRGGQRLQRAIPIRQVHVDFAHFDAVLARVTHELGGRVKAKRLGVQHRRDEDIGVAAFHPAGSVDEQREARGMAFRKAIFAEPLDLMKAALGELTRIAVDHHAFDHLLLKRLDCAGSAKRRHRAAQLVGFRGRETGGDDGDLHRLLLEQRHAESIA